MSPSIVVSTSCELTTAPANDEQSACVVCAVLPARSVREGSTSAARRASMPQRSTSAQSTRCATLCLLRDRRGERARAGAHVVLERLSWRHLRRRQDGRGISPAASGTSGWDGMGAPGTFGCSSAVVRGEQGGCQHLLSAPVRTCWHRQSNIAFPGIFFTVVPGKRKKRTAPQAPAGGREEMGRGKEGTGRKKEGLDNQSEPRGGEMRGCALRVACDGLPAHHLAFSVALLA